MGVGGSLHRFGVQLRNALLEEVDAVDVESLALDQLGAELKFIRSTVERLELHAARYWWAAASNRPIRLVVQVSSSRLPSASP